MSRRTQGFSLLEVVIAIGIIATTMIPIMAMIPSGMESARQSREEVANGEIVRMIANDLSLADWETSNNLLSLNGSSWFFDRSGSTMEKRTRKTTYEARIEIHDDVKMPGGTSNGWAKRVTIRVTSKPENVDTRFTDPKFYRETAIIVAKTDK